MNESVRQKFLFSRPGKLETDLSKNYMNKIFFAAKRDKALFSANITQMSKGQLIWHINAYRHEIRRKGTRMDIFDNVAVT